MHGFEEFEAGTHPRNNDTDGDGLSDAHELGVLGNLAFVTNPLDLDSDNDRLSDGEELQLYQPGPAFDATGNEIFLAPETSDPNHADTDGDTLSDHDERRNGAFSRTSVRKSDTDDDGVRDDRERILGTSPLNAGEMCVRVTYTVFRAIKDCAPLTTGHFVGALKAENTSTNIVQTITDIEVMLNDNGSVNLNKSKDFRLERDATLRLVAAGLKETTGGDVFFDFGHQDGVTFTFEQLLGGTQSGSQEVPGNAFPDDCRIDISFRLSPLGDQDVVQGGQDGDDRTFCQGFLLPTP